MVDDILHTFLIFIGGFLKHAVEASVETGYESLVLFCLFSLVRF